MENSVCFIGHRKIEYTPKLRERLKDILQGLIENGTVDFIFGDKSEFDRLCYDLVTELKEKHPKIRRIHFRTDYWDADDYTMKFLLAGFEESVCPNEVKNAGRAAYIKRNRAMINKSDICVFYYNNGYLPPRRKTAKADLCDYQPQSGTALAYKYAKSKGKKIINCFELAALCPPFNRDCHGVNASQ